jgi:hypothetical protein
MRWSQDDHLFTAYQYAAANARRIAPPRRRGRPRVHAPWSSCAAHACLVPPKPWPETQIAGLPATPAAWLLYLCPCRVAPHRAPPCSSCARPVGDDAPSGSYYAPPYSSHAPDWPHHATRWPITLAFAPLPRLCDPRPTHHWVDQGRGCSRGRLALAGRPPGSAAVR